MDTDPTAWSLFQPTVETRIIANILTNHQDNTTQPSANSVIKNNIVLLTIVIGVPIILAILIVIVCLRRNARRKALEQKRKELLEQKAQRFAVTETVGEIPDQTNADEPEIQAEPSRLSKQEIPDKEIPEISRHSKLVKED